MTEEEREELLRNAPPEENLEAKYDTLSSAFAEQARTMKKVAAELRELAELGAPLHKVPIDCVERSLDELADELDPREPLSEADAAERFARECAARKPK